MAVKLEPAVLEAIKTQICGAQEITSVSLVQSLEDVHNYKFTESQVIGYVRDTELVDLVELRKDDQNRLVYAWKSELQQNASRLQLNKVETEAFKHIHDASSSGMKSSWLRQKLGIPQKDIKRVLDRLVMSGLVKKTNLGKRIIFHRSDVELDESVTGGFFYDDKKPDVQSIDIARNMITKYLAGRVGAYSANARRHTSIIPILVGGRECGASVREITEYINSLKIFNDVAKPGDMQQVLETMRFDDLVNNFEYKEETIYYLVRNSYPEFFGFSHCPCSVCPVREQCSVNAAVNPQTCEYFTNWLNEF